jgi:hypothetical protein
MATLEYDEELHNRRRTAKKSSASATVSQIFEMGDKRSRANIGESNLSPTEAKNTKNALMNVIKNPKTFGLGQNLGGSSL